MAHSRKRLWPGVWPPAPRIWEGPLSAELPARPGEWATPHGGGNATQAYNDFLLAYSALDLHLEYRLGGGRGDGYGKVHGYLSQGDR